MEKKVVRLEDKVTILETAMAGLARRILDVEQNTGLNYRIIFLYCLHILVPFFHPHVALVTGNFLSLVIVCLLGSTG